MILVDTSAWIEFLRNTGSTQCEAVDALLESEHAVCDAIWMEILAGGRDETHLAQLRGLLARATTLPTTPADYDQAAALYRTCRPQGRTVRKLIDCLIATVAIEAGCEVLHADADFNVLARHTALRVHSSSLPDTEGV